MEATAAAILRLLRNTDDFPNELYEVASPTSENHRCYTLPQWRAGPPAHLLRLRLLALERLVHLERLLGLLVLMDHRADGLGHR